MINYAANTLLATKISSVNEIATLGERMIVDVKQVAKGMGLDARIGNKFLHADPGYGGSGFPTDTQALVCIGHEYAVSWSIDESVIRVNEGVKARMVKKLRYLCDDSFSGKMVAVLGTTFKPNTDDLREAPLLTIVPALLPCVVWLDDPYKAANRADLLVILTEWDEFPVFELKKLAKKMVRLRPANLRNIYSIRGARCAAFQAFVGSGR